MSYSELMKHDIELCLLEPKHKYKYINLIKNIVFTATRFGPEMQKT